MSTFDAVSGATGNGVTSVSWSHTFSGSNRGAVPMVCHNGTITSVTVDGTGCTQHGSDYTGDSSYKTSLWKLSNPTSGTVTVAVNFSASSTGNCCCVSATNAHQTTASLLDTRANSTNTDPNPTINVSSTSGDLVVAFTVSNTGFTPITPGTGVDERRDNEDVFISQWVGSKTASGTSTTISGTGGFESWNMSGAAIVTAAGGAATNSGWTSSKGGWW